MTKQLDRHIYRELGPIFFGTVALFAALVLMASGPVFSAITSLSNGASPWLILEILGLYLPQMLVYAFPMAMLIAVIIGYTRFSSESEAVAIFAAGISFYRMLVPTAWFALFATGLGLWVSNSVMPAAQRKIQSFENGISNEIAPTTQPYELPPIRSHGTTEAIVYAGGGYDRKKQALLDVTIVAFDPNTGHPSTTIFAESANYDASLDRWVLERAEATSSSGLVFPLANRVVTRYIHGKPADIEPLEADLDNYSFSELAHEIAIRRSDGVDPKTLRTAEVDLWQKIALPCASLVFAMLGAPIALRPQRAASRGVAVTIGIGIILGYYALFKVLAIVATNGALDPAAAAFAPNILGIIMSVILIARATT